ncbi:MAG: uroporphyrinogen decarboxylase family protein, partial [Armatimonadota bacterium]
RGPRRVAGPARGISKLSAGNAASAWETGITRTLYRPFDTSRGILVTDRENWLRVVEFRYPERIPCGIGFSPLTWHTHREKLKEVILRHPLLFPGYQKGKTDFDSFGDVYREGEYYTDNWGCTWYNRIGGLEGQVVGHPLEDWSALAGYEFPDVMTKSERGDRDWNSIRETIAHQRERGELVVGNGERLFDRLYFLRGFENLTADFATDDPHLQVLIDRFTEHQLKLVNEYLKIGVDAIAFHTDIGTQNALMISPAKFRKYIKPMFMTLFRPIREAGAHVILSSDGRLIEIVDDLIECGVSVHDPQLRANTLDDIEKFYKGRLCANVDLDRQMWAFCTPEDIDAQVRQVVERLYTPEGGLMVSASVWDANTPLENIDALCTALEKHVLSITSVG